MYFYNLVFGDARASLRNAFWHCGQIAVLGQHAHITLAVPALGNLDGLISSFIGEPATRTLQRDKKLALGDLTLHLSTQRLPVRYRGPALAAFTPIAQVEGLARSPYVTDLAYIPWQEDELPAYLKLFPQAQPIPEAPTKAPE